MKSLYLLVNLGAFVVPFIFSFHPRLAFYKHWKATWMAIISSAILFIAWDMVYTKIGVWGFNPKYLLGIYIYNLPIEEILFFICIPFSCLFTIHCFQVLLKRDYFERFTDAITITFLVFFIVFGIIFYDKLYTFATMFGVFGLLAFIRYHLRVTWLSHFYFSYAILLVPFFIVNGILTGTGLQEPVVWYNNSENMGYRVLTIPFEDFFYGMFLILLNYVIYRSINQTKSVR